MAKYLRGLELAKKEDYAAGDRIFERISPAFSVFWAGYYLEGATKLALGQSAQAETILAKYLGRVPDDLKAGPLIAAAAPQHPAASRALQYPKPIVRQRPDATA